MLNKIKKNPNLIQKVINPTEEMCLAAVRRNGLLLKYITNQTEKICITAMKKNLLALRSVENVTEKIYEAAKRIHYDLNVPEEIRDPKIYHLTKYKIGNPQYVRLLAYSPCLLPHIKNQTRKLCLTEVKANGLALRFVGKENFDGCKPIEQTEEICIAAVKQNGYALTFVHKQTKKICCAAVAQDGLVIALVGQKLYPEHIVVKQNEKMCLIAIKRDGNALPDIKKQTKKICSYATLWRPEIRAIAKFGTEFPPIHYMWREQFIFKRGYPNVVYPKIRYIRMWISMLVCIRTKKFYDIKLSFE